MKLSILNSKWRMNSRLVVCMLAMQVMSCSRGVDLDEAVDLSPFLDGVVIQDASTSSPTELDGPLEAGKGRMLVICLTPTSELPATWKNRNVAKVEDWQVMLTLRSLDDIEGQAGVSGQYLCPPLDIAKTKPFSMGGHLGWLEAGFEAPKGGKLNQDDLQSTHCWAGNLGYRDHPGGKYVCELVIFPTYRDISAVRYETGPSHVIMRGVVDIE